MEKLELPSDSHLINSIALCLHGLSLKPSIPPGASALLKVCVKSLTTILEYYKLD